jgi:hypothetical protein
LLIVAPFRWVEFFKGNELERDGKVDQVKINVVQSKIFKRAIESLGNMFLVVIGVPQL